MQKYKILNYLANNYGNKELFTKLYEKFIKETKNFKRNEEIILYIDNKINDLLKRSTLVSFIISTIFFLFVFINDYKHVPTEYFGTYLILFLFFYINLFLSGIFILNNTRKYEIIFYYHIKKFLKEQIQKNKQKL